MDERMIENTPEKRQKRHPVRHFFLFLLILLAVLAVVVLAAWRDGTGFDALRRLVSYTGTESESGAVFSYDASGSNRFAALDEGMAVLSGTELQVLDSRGRQVYTAPVNMSAPALTVNGGRAAAYDVGGTTLYVVDSDGRELLQLTQDSEEPLISATLNAEGWLAVTAEAKGCKGAVTVYNADMNEVYRFNSSERFVTEACVTENCKSLAAVTLGQSSGTFVSSIVLYDLDQEEPRGSCIVENGLVLALGQQEDTLVALSENALTMAGTDGAVTASYSFTGEYLREYALTGEGYSVVLLNRYQSGSVGRLVSVDTAGEALGQLDIREEVLSVTAAGRYVAVLYADRLVIYNPELQAYATLNGTNAAKTALVRKDGSALLAGADSAQLFLP